MAESLGGWVALWLAVRHPALVDHLVLEGPAGLRAGGKGGLPADPAERHRQLYAIPSVIGASFTVALWSTSSLSTLTVGFAVALVLGLRLVAMRFHLNVPGPWRGGARGG